MIIIGKTLREISEELQITNQAVYQRMESIQGFREDHTTMIGNRIIVDEYGEQLIVNFEKNDKYNQQKHHQERKEDKIDVLIHQLSVKDDQIKELQAELSQQQWIESDILGENRGLKERVEQLENNIKNRHKTWKLW